jgi:hypothetical protein
VKRELKRTIFELVFSALIQGFSKREKVDQPERFQRLRIINSAQNMQRK